MKKSLKKLCGVISSIVLSASMVVSAYAVPTAPARSGSTYKDVVSAYTKTTSLTWIVNDSWIKKVPVTGFKNTDHEQYCNIYVGFDDGAFSDTDYMYTGVQTGSSYTADVLETVYICGKIENASYKSSWSSWKTNGGVCAKISAKHSGTAKYYIAFSW